MAICKMAKVMIVSHRREAEALMEVLQEEGIVEILDAQRAMVTKDWPELHVEVQRPKDLEERVARLDKAVAFLKSHSATKSSALRPRAKVDWRRYSLVVSGPSALELLGQAERTASELDKLDTEIENLRGHLDWLRPWQALSIPVEQLYSLHHAACLAGLVSNQHLPQVTETLTAMGGAIESVGRDGVHHACVIVCLKEQQAQVQKILRAVDFEPVSFEGMRGTAAELIEQNRSRLARLERSRHDADHRAQGLSSEVLSLQILFDHDRNLLRREKVRVSSPATEQVVLLEGWIKEKDFPRLQKRVGQFGASSVERMEIAEGEEVPVEIENPALVRPFESITRLYGMPQTSSVDPTVFLAPFFALFYGLCMCDVGYGLVTLAFLWFLLRRMQGGKMFLRLFMISSVLTVLAGLLTGSWFGDAITQFVPGLEPLRQSVMLFDPMAEPLKLFGLSLALGYIQIIFGIFIAFMNNILRKQFVAAVCDQLTWLVLLNSIMAIAFSKVGVLPAWVASVCGIIVIVPAVMILLFSVREGPWGGRLGMGTYQLFSTVFYVGDILSYGRLMALCMVGSGFGMAINVITKQLMGVPYAGYFLAAIVFVGGHLFNIGMSSLGAFVHSLRLQFIEFFSKFLAGGGRDFVPLKTNYSQILITDPGHTE
jgi:V/A-type H+/Na+-transporting ATPase subunit I